MIKTKPRNTSSTVFAIASLASPIISLGGMLLYQQVANASFWRTIQRDEAHVAGLMAAAEIFQSMFALGFGLSIGVILGVLGYKRRKQLLSLSALALFINALLLSLLVSLWLYLRVHTS